MNVHSPLVLLVTVVQVPQTLCLSIVRIVSPPSSPYPSSVEWGVDADNPPISRRLYIPRITLDVVIGTVCTGSRRQDRDSDRADFRSDLVLRPPSLEQASGEGNH